MRGCVSLTHSELTVSGLGCVAGGNGTAKKLRMRATPPNNR